MTDREKEIGRNLSCLVNKLSKLPPESADRAYSAISSYINGMIDQMGIQDHRTMT